MKSRMLPYSWKYLIGKFDEMVATSHGWGAGAFTGTLDFCVKCKACVQFTRHVGLTSVFYNLSRIPFLMARLEQPGVAQECLAQYRSCPRRHHDKISIRILDDTRAFYDDVLAIRPDGSGLSPQLLIEV